ncbi:unnamed protein product [Prunus armeniaca]|uniref:PB1-like domain-containing protein n=2 Tax=Prunus armeniaca TaxID=36596 RepID=A0A6J5XIV5_PRUAR|nr:unnamed protein product [Prunus armeniaca]
MSWDFRALGPPHRSYGFSGIVGEDRMSMTEIDNMVRELGYDRVISYWYSIHIYSNGGLTKLNDDQDVIDTLVFVQETRLIDIFLHHGVDSNEEANTVPTRGVVIEELDDNYGLLFLLRELNEDPNGEQSGGGMQKPRESSARQGVSKKGKQKVVERESSAVQKDKERAVKRESSATVEKGKSKVSSVLGKKRCKNAKTTRDKDQRSNTVTEGLV